jgi:two-component system, cell cycle response regulator CpdR
MDPSVLEVIAEMLKDLGWEVISAARGPDALEKPKGHERISILITDINMPGMDGHELAERARRIKPELKILQLSRSGAAPGPALQQAAH